jgi:carboxyl-terminal processing protease
MKDKKSFLLFIIISISLIVGFLVGIYKYEIMAAIGPVFGYKSYSTDLNLSSLKETYNTLARDYDGELDLNLLIEGANRGMVAAAGDDYTVYMSKAEVEEFNKSLTGNIGGGIGAEIGIKNDKITIIRALANNPAEKAGLNANDIILSINDESTVDFTVEKAVGKIRGDVGTTVKLSIQRGSEIKEFTITREIINNPSVESSVVDGIGILTISRFDDKTGSLARLAAQDFKRQNVKGIILDLRGNGGGYVSAARDVAGLWLNDMLVMTEKASGLITDTVRTGNSAILNGLPTTVLINGGSASASEIVAGSLRDHKIAKLVGEKSFGKGSMQKLSSLGGGAQLKITIAKWYTPNDINVNQNGLEPDVTVDLNQSDIDEGVDTQMEAAKKALGL